MKSKKQKKLKQTTQIQASQAAPDGSRRSMSISTDDPQMQGAIKDLVDKFERQTVQAQVAQQQELGQPVMSSQQHVVAEPTQKPVSQLQSQLQQMPDQQVIRVFMQEQDQQQRLQQARDPYRGRAIGNPDTGFQKEQGGQIVGVNPLPVRRADEHTQRDADVRDINRSGVHSKQQFQPKVQQYTQVTQDNYDQIIRQVMDQITPPNQLSQGQDPTWGSPVKQPGVGLGSDGKPLQQIPYPDTKRVPKKYQRGMDQPGDTWHQDQKLIVTNSVDGKEKNMLNQHQEDNFNMDEFFQEVNKQGQDTSVFEQKTKMNKVKNIGQGKDNDYEVG